MSPLVQQIFHQIDRLSLAEQIEILKHTAEQIEHSVAAPKYKVTDFFGKSPNLTNGVDAQAWVNQLRDEWEDRDTQRTPA
jgi:hypothetical protein